MVVEPVAFDPSAFIRIAELVVEVNATEEGYRTAVGRLYYSAFLTARDALGEPGGRNVHSRVIGRLIAHDKVAGGQIKRLHAIHVLADYEMNIQNPLRSDWRRNYDTARNLTAFVMRRLADIRGGQP